MKPLLTDILCTLFVALAFGLAAVILMAAY